MVKNLCFLKIKTEFFVREELNYLAQSLRSRYSTFPKLGFLCSVLETKGTTTDDLNKVWRFLSVGWTMKVCRNHTHEFCTCIEPTVVSSNNIEGPINVTL